MYLFPVKYNAEHKPILDSTNHFLWEKLQHLSDVLGCDSFYPLKLYLFAASHHTLCTKNIFPNSDCCKSDKQRRLSKVSRPNKPSNNNLQRDLFLSGGQYIYPAALLHMLHTINHELKQRHGSQCKDCNLYRTIRPIHNPILSLFFFSEAFSTIVCIISNVILQKAFHTILYNKAFLWMVFIHCLTLGLLLLLYVVNY